MQDKLQIPHKKICLTVFIVAGLILTIFYYDNSILNYAVPYSSQEVAFVEVQTEIDVISGTTSTIKTSTTTTSTTVSIDLPNSTQSLLKLFNSSSRSSSSYSSSSTTISTTVSTTTYNTTSSSSNVTNTSHVTPSTVGSTRRILHTSTVENVTLPPPESEYLVWSPKCKIPNYNPFNAEAKRYYHKVKYKSCRSKELLSYVTVIDNIATLHVDMERVPSYTSNAVSCCYSNITRVNYNKDPDGKIKLSSCQYFENNTTISEDPILIKCVDSKSRKQVYENVHVALTINEKIQKKIDNFDNTADPFSILFVGIDSISRLNFIRTLPNTYKFVEDNGWLPLKGYNKMDDNTFPNLMAILTGFNNSRSYAVCNPKALGMLDKCPMIWYDYRKLGYITAYGEDSGSINTFNYRKKGFVVPPTDFYYRPYILGCEKLHEITLEGGPYCTGPESSGERIMNLAKNFAITFKNYSTFGFFWMNSFSHNNVNTPSSMDDKVKNFLSDITNNGVTNNTIVIFLSDHGMRFGEIRLTNTGWLEERLPFIYVSFPDWFKKRFPKEYQNFITNSNRFTTPYDLHMTLQHILVLSGRDFNVTNSEACPRCKSLLEEAEPDRSCTESGIDQHWCTCAGYKRTKLTNAVKNKLSEFLLNIIHDIIRSRNKDHRCAKYVVDKVLDSRISQSFNAQNESFILFQVQTRPKAIFETTISFVEDLNHSNFSISGDISRLDSYNQHSKCVSDAYLRKYCYCSTNGEKV